MRESFIFYRSFYESIKELDPLDQVQIYNAIFEYEFYKKNNELKGVCKSIFTLIIPQLIANDKRYENGKKGGAPKGNQNAKKQPKNNLETTEKQPNVNVNVNVNENDNVNDIYNYIEQNFCRTLNPLEYEEISKWQDNELTRYAIKEAILGGKYNIKYISAILHNYKMNNIKTVQQAEEQKNKFKNKGEPIPSWFDKKIEKVEATKEEQDEIERLLGEYK